MKKIFKISALLIAVVFAFSGAVYPWGTTAGDGSRVQAMQETAVFHNDSGITLVEGMIVILDTDDGTAGSTLGSYVTATATVDLSGVVGVVKSISSPDETHVVVITKGPADVLVLDSSDALDISNFVGTSSQTGYGGAFGTITGGAGYVGKALEAGDGTDTGKVWVWVDPGVAF